MIRWEPRHSLSFRVFPVLVVAASASVYDCETHGREHLTISCRVVLPSARQKLTCLSVFFPKWP